MAVFGFSSSITFPPYFSGLSKNSELQLLSSSYKSVSRDMLVRNTIRSQGCSFALWWTKSCASAVKKRNDDVKELEKCVCLCFNTRHTFTHPAAAAVVKTLARTQSSQDTLEQKKC